MPSSLQCSPINQSFSSCSFAHYMFAGTYFLNFTGAFDTAADITPARLQVNIVPCPPGFVTGGRKDTCNKCPEGLFTFEPKSAQCSVCGANFECPGGATVWPDKGFWHSAPRSIQMHRWVASAIVLCHVHPARLHRTFPASETVRFNRVPNVADVAGLVSKRAQKRQKGRAGQRRVANVAANTKTVPRQFSTRSRTLRRLHIALLMFSVIHGAGLGLARPVKRPVSKRVPKVPDLQK